jgi:CubicO group peptidase (beta-lactamase class C family)
VSGGVAAVERAADDLLGRSAGTTLALVAVRAGEVVVERYGVRPANDFQDEEPIGPDSTLISWSMAKSITHALVGVLVADGALDPDEPAPVPEWEGTDAAAITLLDLLEMRSGLRFVEDYVDDSVSHCIEMLFGDSGPSHAAYAAALPSEHPPGAHWSYSSGTTNIVSRIAGDAIVAAASGGGVGGAADATPARRRETIESFLHDRLFAPSGMSSAVPKFDDAGDFVGSSFVYATARDFARFGELYVHDGVTDLGAGRRILPEGWRDHGRTIVAHDPDSGFDYGRHWWSWPAFPGSMAAHGYEGQFTLVLPESDLVLVHLGITGREHHPGLTMGLARIAQALAM